MTSWKHLVANLGTWKRGTQRAVHKPLLTLMLLARAQRGESNEVRYADIADDLKAALAQFGPPRRVHHPEFPFWYLQNDGFWEIPHGGRLPSRAGKKQPTHRALIDNDVVGRVPLVRWQELQGEDIPALARKVLEEFWTPAYFDDIATALGLCLAPAQTNRRDPAFRGKVLMAYEKRCAICGFDGRLGDQLVGLEAAHVLWKQHGGPDEVANGLALCSLHHKVFDRGGLGLDDNLQVIVSRHLTGQQFVHDAIHSFLGQPLLGPQRGEPRPNLDFVRWHRENVFQKPAREL